MVRVSRMYALWVQLVIVKREKVSSFMYTTALFLFSPLFNYCGFSMLDKMYTSYHKMVYKHDARCDFHKIVIYCSLFELQITKMSVEKTS